MEVKIINGKPYYLKNGIYYPVRRKKIKLARPSWAVK